MYTHVGAVVQLSDLPLVDSYSHFKLTRQPAMMAYLSLHADLLTMIKSLAHQLLST
jgi:hypothetical protein